jgi:intracellular septation protein
MMQDPSAHGVSRKTVQAQGASPQPSQPSLEAAETSPLKLVLDIGPLLAFFLTYALAGLRLATIVIIVTTVAALIASRVFLGKIPVVALISAALIVVLGGLTVWFDDPRFVKIKPTIAYLVFAGLLLGGQLMGRAPLKAVVGKAFAVTDTGWRILTLRWGWFFVGMAALNEILWRNFSEQTWVTFKSFGFLVLTIMFVALQKTVLEHHGLEGKR